MINRTMFIIIMIFGCSFLESVSNQELFLRGNKAYRDADYQDALHYYEQIPQKGDAVWHNMGNCYSCLEDPVNACVHWQRAKKHAAYDDYCTLETQIAAVDETTVNTVNNSWIFWVRAHTASYSLFLIQIITLLFWFALCIAIRKRIHWSMIFLLLIFSVFFIWLSVDMQRQWCRLYAVTTEPITVYVGPNLAYHEQGSVKSARVITILDEREGWYKIAYKQLAGWVQADKLIKV